MGNNDETDGSGQNGQGEEHDWFVDISVVVNEGRHLRMGYRLGVMMIGIGGSWNMHDKDAFGGVGTVEESLKIVKKSHMANGEVDVLYC